MNQIITTLKNRTYVRQSNHLVRSSYKLNALAQDILHIVLTQIKKEDTTLPIFRISIKEVANRINTSNRDPKRIKAVNLELAGDQLIESKIVFQNGSRNDKFSWCSRFSYDTKQGWIELQIHDQLYEYLLELTTHFTLLETQYFLALQNLYAKRVYMIMKSYIGSQGKYKQIITYSPTVEELVDTIGAPESYKKNYADLKKRILRTVEDQINEYTDITVKFKEEKLGRKVYRIVFEGFSKTRSDKASSKTGFTSTPMKNTGIKALEEWFNSQEENSNNIVNTEVL